jgi:hypothetical protein
MAELFNGFATLPVHEMLCIGMASPDQTLPAFFNLQA